MGVDRAFVCVWFAVIGRPTAGQFPSPRRQCRTYGNELLIIARHQSAIISALWMVAHGFPDRENVSDKPRIAVFVHWIIFDARAAKLGDGFEDDISVGVARWLAFFVEFGFPIDVNARSDE